MKHPLALLRGRRVFALSVLALILASAALGVTAWHWYVAWRTDAGIAALSRNQDIALAANAAPDLVLARELFLLRHEQLQQAQALAGALERSGDARALSAFYYNIGNHHLREAYDRIAQGKLDDAIPVVTQAKQSYRRALQLRPDFWNAKFNLDVAMRLVRDLPGTKQGEGDTLPASRKLWPDLPGLPEGLP